MSSGRRWTRVLTGLLGGLFGAIAAVLGGLLVRLWLGKARMAAEDRRVGRLSPFGTVQHLSVLPLVDYHAAQDDLATEPGVSYLIRADETNILMDLGLNLRGEHPSPLLRNMERLGVAPDDIDMIFISHLDPDHTGGPDGRELRLSHGPVGLRDVPVFVPARATTAEDNAAPHVEIVSHPRILATGIASTGPMSSARFGRSTTAEQTLAINVTGKGIVLIVGCGQQRIPRLLDRARELFDEPVHAILGGMHLLAPAEREQARMAARAGGGAGPSVAEEREIDETLEAIEAARPAIVAVSPHNSSELSLERFRDVFGDKYVEMKVGEEIVVQDGHRTR